MTCERFVRFVGLFMLSAILASAAAITTADVLTRLGLNELDARELAVESIVSGTVSCDPARKALKALTPAARAELIAEGLAWAKAYTASSDFAVRYAALREQQKPEAPQSAAEKFRQFQADQKKQIEEMKRNLATLPPEACKEAEANIRHVEQMFSDPEELAIMKESWDDQAAAEQAAYRADLAAWEDEYPAAAPTLIARRLRAFLDLSATVDYEAALVKRKASMVFVDSRLESKPRPWKLCFRAGKPAVDAARAFATTWLREIESQRTTTPIR